MVDCPENKCGQICWHVVVLVFLQIQFLGVAQAVLELKKSPCLCLLSTGIKGVHHYHPVVNMFKVMEPCCITTTSTRSSPCKTNCLLGTLPAFPCPAPVPFCFINVIFTKLRSHKSEATWHLLLCLAYFTWCPQIYPQYSTLDFLSILKAKYYSTMWVTAHLSIHP